MLSAVEYDADAHLNFEDIAIDSLEKPMIMQVRIKASKTDPFRKGVELYLGRTSNELCPIAAMLAYQAARGDKPGPLFRYQDGKVLSRDRFVVSVCDALARTGINHKAYAGHSFRIGAATTAAQCKIPQATIKILG